VEELGRNLKLVLSKSVFPITEHREVDLKTVAALICAASLVFPGAAWSEDAPIEIYFAPLLSAIEKKRSWFDNRDKALPDAIRAALSQTPFRPLAYPKDGVLTLAALDGLKTEKEQYVFTVVFMQDNTKLGEAVEFCPIKKLTDCTDQLVSDTKAAAN